MPLAFCLKGGRSRLKTSGVGYSSRDLSIHFHVFFLHNVALHLGDGLPYVRVQFGDVMLRSNLARKTSCERPIFEFDGSNMILKIHKEFTDQCYPDIVVHLYIKPPDAGECSTSDVCLGVARIPVGHYTCENIEISSIPVVCDDQKIANLLFGIIPGIPDISHCLTRCPSPSHSDSHSNSSSTSRSGVSFRFLRKDKAISKTKKVSTVVEDFIHIIFSSTEPCRKFLGGIILSLLELFKTESGRQQFYTQLNAAVQVEKKLEPVAFQTLVDIFRAVLREANNHRDFITCRKFKELSMRIKMVSSDGETILFLYSFIRDHEVFKNPQFWEQFFLDIWANERSELESTRDSINATPHQPNLSIDETEEGAECILLIIHLLCIFAWRILNAGCNVETAIAFCVDMCLRNSIPEDTIPLLKKFIRLLSFRTTFNILPSPLSKLAQSRFDAPSCPEAIEYAVSLSILKTPCCDLLTVLEQSEQIRQFNLLPSAVSGKNGVPKLECQTNWTWYQTPSGHDLFHDSYINGSTWAISEQFQEYDSESEHGVPSERRDSILKSPSFPLGNSLVNGEIVLRMLYAVIDENTPPRPRGSLLLTTYRLIFIRDSKDVSDCLHGNFSASSLPISGYDSTVGVHSILKFGVKPVSDAAGGDKILLITLKDNQVLRYRLKMLPTSKVNRDQMIAEFTDLVYWAAWPQNLDQLFAFRYKLSVSVPDNGWDIYTAEKEYQRMGVTFSPHWRRVTLNFEFGFCPTYPPLFFVPSSVSNEVLHKVFLFRSRSRIPVLSYFIPDSGAAMMRSAQPRTGVTGSHCIEDEQLIAAAKIRYVIDCRPKINARGNKVLGGGFESANRYPNCQVVFMGIENIHVIRDSFRVMVETVAGVMSSIRGSDTGSSYFCPELADSGWNKHLRQILLAAVFTVTKLSVEKASLLVHCSDGWDRTSQVVSLSMLLIDDFYRTLTGFIVLIEKEWLSFGHKFHRRIGHGDAMYSDSQRSPVFIQFLDAIWQVMSQYPNAFEFNVNLLLRIAHELFECKFGTFLCNSEKERSNIHLRAKTISLWTCVMSQKQSYLNSSYKPITGLIQPNCNLNAFTVFPFYFRFSAPHLQQAYEPLSNLTNHLRHAQESHRLNSMDLIASFKKREALLLHAVSVLQASRDGLIPQEKTDWIHFLEINGVSTSNQLYPGTTPLPTPISHSPPSDRNESTGQEDSMSSLSAIQHERQIRRKRAKSA